MSVHLLVTCEKQQELDDLEKVAYELKQEDKDIIITFVNMGIFTGEEMHVSTLLFNNVTTPLPLFKGAYYKLGIIKKMITVVYGISLLLNICIKSGVTHIVYGVPIVFFRAINFVPFRKFRTYSYIRSNIAINNVSERKISSFLAKFFKKYVADHFFCIDDVTNKFINNLYPACRGNKSLNIGSIYSYSLFMQNKTQGQQSSQEVQNICFLTSAFSWHGDADAGFEQVLLAELLLKTIQEFNSNYSKKINFYIKLHPRDNIGSYISLLEQDGCYVFESSQLEAADQSYCFLSILSTMSFELAISGYKSLYVCSDFFKTKYDEWYRNNKVLPMDLLDDELINKIIKSEPSTQYQFVDKYSPQKKLALFLLDR